MPFPVLYTEILVQRETTQLNQLQDTILSQQSPTQTIEKIEARLLTMEEEMRSFTETLSKLKSPDE